MTSSVYVIELLAIIRPLLFYCSKSISCDWWLILVRENLNKHVVTKTLKLLLVIVIFSFYLLFFFQYNINYIHVLHNLIDNLKINVLSFSWRKFLKQKYLSHCPILLRRCHTNRKNKTNQHLHDQVTTVFWNSVIGLERIWDQKGNSNNHN